MQKPNNNPNPQDKKPNNFFNQNPLLMFVIFAIIAIVIFRMMFTNGWRSQQTKWSNYNQNN